MVEHALAQGHEALSLTDHDEVNGHISMWNLCKEAGIKFIPGAEQRWLHDVGESRKYATRGLDNSHIILLAQNNEGLKNLWTLSSLAYEPGNFYGKPQLHPELMRQYSSGLWASDGCGLTRFAEFVENDQMDEARQEWAVLLDIFGDHFYSELHTFQFIPTEERPLTDEEQQITNKITKMNLAKVQFSQEMGVPLVVVNDSHYAPESDWEQHRLVWKMSTGKNKKKGSDQVQGNTHAADWMMDVDEIKHWMGIHGVRDSIVEEAIKNTKWIADQCNVEIKPTISMPRLYDTDVEDAAAFRRSCEEGLKRFILDKGLPEDVYRPRLEREMKLIVDKDMAGYFNVVGDYVMKARDGSYVKYLPGRGGSKPTPCVCGPGRGSGGGSLVNYVLGITSLDPIKYNLSFERFINPDRPDYPDIDVDFQKTHRKDLIGYMRARYGEDKVVAIGTKSKSGPAKTLQDLCIAMDIPYKDSVAMSKLIRKVDFSDNHDYDLEPDYEPPPWSEVIELLGGDLAPYVQLHPKLFENVEKMVGLSRQAGVHAAGIVAMTEPYLGLVPTRRKGGDPSAPISTQFDMNEVAWLGGVKDDFLSNNGLDVLAMARDMIFERHGVWIDYDGFGFGIPEGAEKVITMGSEYYSDPAIWEQIDNGYTAGIFQINTPGGTKQAMRFKPRNEVDLADLVAINRPGVLRVPGLLKSYLARRAGEEPITYDHPLLEQILAPTMGILVYQEDLVLATRVLAGFTPGQGETLRKAIGKKKLDLMMSFETQFIQGCLANPEFTRHGSEMIARRIWASLLASASYAFNRAHSVGYSTQACQEIWVKHYYFDEFVTACLAVYGDQVMKDGTKKSLVFIRECRRMKKPILPPCANRSGARFTLTDDGIRYGLVDIKGIGDAPIAEIVSKRPYVDLQDYLDRTSKSKGWKRGVVDSLIKIGAFDWTGDSRSNMLDQYYYHQARHEIAEKKRNTISQEETDEIVFGKWRAKPEAYPRHKFHDDDVVRQIELDLVGTFITKNPMEPYIDMINSECISHPSEFEDFETGQRFTIGGQLTRVHEHMQRNNKKMAFITIRWNEEDFEFLAFADSYAACKPMLQIGAPIACDVIKLDGDSANLHSALRLDKL
jgi:DNA polymerase-3 subunit alpha